MNDRQLRYALTVWRERSFSKASGRLNVSQPAVSDQIKALEQELGFELFVRTGRGVEPTYIGRAFLQHADSAIDKLLDLTNTARQLRGDSPRDSFSLGFSASVPRDVAMDALTRLNPALARVRLEVVTAQTRRINRFVLERRLDAAIAIEADPRSLPKDLISARIASLELALITPWKHRLARKPSVGPAELREERLIAVEPDIGYGPIAQTMFAGHGVAPHIVARADDIETVKLMIAAGAGIAVLPRNCATSEIVLKQLRAVPIRPRHEAHVTLLRHPDAVSPAAASCLELLKGGNDA